MKETGSEAGGNILANGQSWGRVLVLQAKIPAAQHPDMEGTGALFTEDVIRLLPIEK